MGLVPEYRSQGKKYRTKINQSKPKRKDIKKKKKNYTNLQGNCERIMNLSKIQKCRKK